MSELNDEACTLHKIFCLPNCGKWINDNKFSKVALQIPIENKFQSLHIQMELRKMTECSLFEIVKGTDSCCSWDLDGKKRDADAIIHFGDACLSPSNTMPVLYVLSPSTKIDVEQITKSILEMHIPSNEKLILFYDSCNVNLSEKIFSALRTSLKNLINSSLEPPDGGYLVYENSCIQSSNESSYSKTLYYGRTANLPEGSSISDYNFVYFGSSFKTLNVFQHRFSQNTFYHIDNNCSTNIIKDSIKMVMNRSNKIELIKQANIIGIVYGTVTIKGATDIKSRMRHWIKNSFKRPITIILLDMNENKLANFECCDLFVYINCPQSTLFDRLEHNYIYKKVVTPWEVEVALNPNFEWSLNFELNYMEFLQGRSLHTELLPTIDPLVDDEKKCVEMTQALSIRTAGALSMVSNIHTNTWRGLDPNLKPETDIVEVIQGRKGIAISYEGEGGKS